MLKKVELWSFKLQLALSLVLFFLGLGMEYVKQFKVLLFSLTILLLMVGLIALNIASTPEQGVPPINISSAVIANNPSLEEESLSEAEVVTQISAYEQLLQLQPTHRDLLVNIALLYQAKMDDKRSAYYWQQAQKQDPNSPLFEQSSLSSL